ncbi:MAG: hypothetical protein ACODAF_07950, partial [Actinomycetota bacterium]
MNAHARQRWLWAAVLLVAFAVGTVAGGYAASQQAESGDVSGLAAMIALESSGPGPAGPSSGDQLRLSLYNTGDTAVTVREARPLGWTAETGTDRTVPPQQWTTVPLRISPDCDAAPGDRIRLRVNGDGEDGEDGEVTLPLRAGLGQVAARHAYLCSRPASTVSIDDVETRAVDDELEMRLSMRLQGPSDASQTISYPSVVEGSGYRLEVVPPSVTLRSGETATVTARWTVADCGETDPLGAAVQLTVGGGAAEPQFPNQVPAALARFSA